MGLCGGRKFLQFDFRFARQPQFKPSDRRPQVVAVWRFDRGRGIHRRIMIMQWAREVNSWRIPVVALRRALDYICDMKMMFASILAAFCAMSLQAQIHTQTVEYNRGDAKFEGWLA